MDATFASQEFESLKAAEGDEFKVEGAGAIGRADDNVDVLDCGDARTTPSPVAGSVAGSTSWLASSRHRCWSLRRWDAGHPERGITRVNRTSTWPDRGVRVPS